MGALFLGKSTLLQVLAGQHMVGPDVVRILGRPAFHDVVSFVCTFQLHVYAMLHDLFLVLAATDIIR